MRRGESGDMGLRGETHTQRRKIPDRHSDSGRAGESDRSLTRPEQGGGVGGQIDL